MSCFKRTKVNCSKEAKIKQVQIFFYFVTFYLVMYLYLECYELARRNNIFSTSYQHFCNM